MTVSVATVPAIADSDIAWDHKPVDRCEVVTDFHRLGEFWPDWQRLWESDPRAEIFQTPEWARAWWSTFGHHYTLCALVAFSGDEVAGILPLARRDRRLQFLGTPEADYGDVVCEDRRAAAVLTATFRTLTQSVGGWEECCFEHLSRNSRLVRHYRELPQDVRARLRCVPTERQQTLILRRQREGVFNALLGKHHTKRLQNKLRKTGKLRFRYLTTPAEAEHQLPEFFRHHVRRHAAVGRRSAFCDPEARQFLHAAIQEIGPERRVRFGVLELDERPLAWALGFEANGKFLLYQHTFDMDAGRYTPGEVLLWNTLEYARDHVSRELDFGKGDELYKDRFTNYSRETYALFFEPAGLGGRVRGMIRSLQSRLQPALGKIEEVAKSRRATLRAFRAARMWMLGVMGGMRQARKNGALLPYGVHLTRQWFGHTIWSRRSTDVFALPNSRLPIAVSENDPEPDGDVQVSRVQIGELVDLAWQNPEILSLSELSDCRARLKKGDQPYLVREKSAVVAVCWAASNLPSEGDSFPQFGTTPAFVVNEFWSDRTRDLAAPYRALLSVLLKDAAAQNLDLLVHCGSNQAGLRSELERQGFAPKFRTTCYRIFNRIRRDFTAPCLKPTARPSPVVEEP